jgi:hypothetical protein
MSALLLWIECYARAALILGIALCIGYPVSRRILRGPAAPLLALLVGMALFGLLVSLLAWLQIFRGLGVVIIGVAAAGVSVRYLRRDLPGWRRRLLAVWPPRLPVIAGFAVLAGALLFYSALSLYPVTAFDATSYHLPLARDLVQHHGLVYDPFVRYSFFPQANESMFAVMQLMSKNAISSGALEYGILAVSVLLLPLWFLGSGRGIAGGLVAGLIVLASPVLILAGTVPYVDVWAMVFVLGGLLVGLEVAEGRVAPVPGLALAGLLLGEAAATKYLAIGFAAAAAFGVLVAGGRSRIPLRGLAAAAGACLVIALPWYAWTIHTTGDPLYPFATSVFGNRSGLWTASEIHGQQVNEMRSLGTGLHRDVEYLLGNHQYDTGRGRSPLSWWLGVGFLGLLVPSLRRCRSFLGVTVTGVLSVAMMLPLSSNPRYFIPAIAPLSISAGLLAEWGGRAARRLLPGWLRDPRLAPVWCLTAAAVVLFSSSRWERGIIRARGGPPTTTEATDAYLLSHVPCYPAIRYLNLHAGSHYRAWAYSCEQDHYYASGRLLGDAFSVGGRLRIFDDHGHTLPSDQTLWRRLAPLDVRWIVLPSFFVSRPETLAEHGLFRYIVTLDSMDVLAVRPS